MQFRFYTSVLVAASLALWGCSPTKDPVTAAAVLKSMKKDINSTSEDAVSANVTSLLLSSYPILEEVCSNVFKTPNYSFDGDKLRFKLTKLAYKLPVEDMANSQLYRHQYGICFDFYPSTSYEVVQEALYVSYLGTIASDVDKMNVTVNSIPGGYAALLSDAGFHTGLEFTENGWTSVEKKAYSDETNAVQYLKMNPLDMKVLNKYGGEKFSKLMAFEFVHGFVSNVSGSIQFHNITESLYSHVFGVPNATVTP